MKKKEIKIQNIYKDYIYSINKYYINIYKDVVYILSFFFFFIGQEFWTEPWSRRNSQSHGNPDAHAHRYASWGELDRTDERGSLFRGRTPTESCCYTL